METAVPVFPAMPSLAFSSRVMRAVRPGLDAANFTAAWDLIVIYEIEEPEQISQATFSTAVRMMRASASRLSASSSEAKSLSMTAPAPFRWLPSVR